AAAFKPFVSGGCDATIADLSLGNLDVMSCDIDALRWIDTVGLQVDERMVQRLVRESVSMGTCAEFPAKENLQWMCAHGFFKIGGQGVLQHVLEIMRPTSDRLASVLRQD